MQRYYNDVVRSTWNVLNILYQKILGMTLMIKREFYKIVLMLDGLLSRR
jgi:hypothetical protein